MTGSIRDLLDWNALARAFGYPDAASMQSTAAREIDELERRAYYAAWWDPRVSDDDLAKLPGAPPPLAPLT